ncbi:MAG: hypothetical protein HYW23_03770 [Candidatus Aenigmarchaeota archaeon]|nr:hypothetical protein [Candidatus Aenigmarchaeota archaeon]
MEFDFLVSEVVSKSNVKKDDILSLVDKKYTEMENLITKEGALYLVAKEMNIELPENKTPGTPIRNIVPGMRNVNFIGRVFKISKTTEFKKANGNAGRVANIFIGDGTGVTRVPLWDDQVKMLEENMISIGDTVQLSNGLSRENSFVGVEVTLGKFGTLTPLEDYADLPSAESLLKGSFSFSVEKTNISDVVAGGNFEIKGVVSQLFRGNFLFTVCPMCGSKLENTKCTEHGEVAPSYAMVISFIADDGTGDLRCVLFRNTAEKLCNMSAEELSKMDPDKRYSILSDSILGKEFIFAGKVKKNDMYDRMEMMVNDFKDINPLEESKKLVNEIELMVGV